MAGIEQQALPFPPVPEIRSVLALDDSAILEGSLATAGFNWDGLTGEVFADGGVCFHDGDEINVGSLIDVYPTGYSFEPDDRILEMIKIAHDIKVGRITVEEH